jgi:DNA-binding Xre family transcriptional regulator
VTADDRDRELGAVLSYLVGRRLSTGELINALGLSRSAYYLARHEGRLITADNLLRVASALNLNAVDLMLRYGLIDPEAVLDCAFRLGPAGRPMAARRLAPRADAPPL